MDGVFRRKDTHFGVGASIPGLVVTREFVPGFGQIGTHGIENNLGSMRWVVWGGGDNIGVFG